MWRMHFCVPCRLVARGPLLHPSCTDNMPFNPARRHERESTLRAVSSGTNLGSAVSLFATSCAVVSGKCPRHGLHKLESYLVDITPAPILARFQRTHYRMPRPVKMF